MKKALATLMALAILLTTVCAIASAENEEIVLEFWNSHYISDTDKTKPEEEWTISVVTREFEEAHPGVKINIVEIADQMVAQNRLKASVLAGEAPDIINMFSGYFVYNMRDILVDVTDLIPDEDREKIAGWAGVEAEGVTYGYPASVLETCVLLYNKDIVASAGVELEGENAPKNAEDLYEAFAKIKATGKEVVISDAKSYNRLYTFVFSSWWTQISGVDRIVADSIGEAKFAEDEGFLKSLQYVADMYRDGYLNKDYESSESAKARFMNGEGAFFPSANIPSEFIDTLGDSLGVYMLPNYDDTVTFPDYAIGGAGQVNCIVQGCEHPEIAVEYLSFLNSHDINIRLINEIGLSLRSDITAEELGYTNDVYRDYIALGGSHHLNWNDNSMQADVSNEFYKLGTMAVVGQLSVEECAAELDQLASDIAENAE